MERVENVKAVAIWGRKVERETGTDVMRVDSAGLIMELDGSESNVNCIYQVYERLGIMSVTPYDYGTLQLGPERFQRLIADYPEGQLYLIPQYETA